MTANAPHTVRPTADEMLLGSGFGEPLPADAYLSLGCMEGVYDPVVQRADKASAPAAKWLSLFPGYVAAAAVVAIAYGLHSLPLAPFRVVGPGGTTRQAISAAILAIIVGTLAKNLLALPESIRTGCRHAVKKIIPVAIVCMGAGVNLVSIRAIGLPAFAIVLISVAAALAGGYYIGRAIGLCPRASLLLGAGTGICGNSAIVAVAPLIDARDEDLALSIGTVNLLGLLAMLLWPVLGFQFGLSSDAYGIWTGTTIHAVPQVVAAGFAYGTGAGELATLVKLVRVTMLAPMVFVLALMHARTHRQAQASLGEAALKVRYKMVVPWFVWGFVGMAVLSTAGLIPSLWFEPTSALGGTTSVSVTAVLKQAGELLLALAMAAIGLELNLRVLARVGARALLAGVLTLAVVSGISLALIRVLI